MPTEIERKFLLHDDSWRNSVSHQQRIIQGYMANTDKCSVRIRVSGDKANINIKSMTIDISRSEYEYPVPVNEANDMLHSLCIKPLIEKTRNYVNDNGHTWEIDEFEGDNKGLVIAELELDKADQQFVSPPWLGKEVSGDLRYFNISLVKNPYKDW
jgi:adenylate cyclase